ncbi:MAG: CHAT domain-containing protein [Ideonella sp.]|nr:CHAT domain-containing protein [Ideonella sp.]
MVAPTCPTLDQPCNVDPLRERFGSATRRAVSLWSVDDAATAALMTQFAQALSRPEPYRYFPAEALRRAMLEVRRRRPDPAHWASFTTFGVPNALRAEP